MPTKPRCSCSGPYLHIDHVPRQVRCPLPGHWWSVPPIELTAPKEQWYMASPKAAS